MSAFWCLLVVNNCDIFGEWPLEDDDFLLLCRFFGVCFGVIEGEDWMTGTIIDGDCDDGARPSDALAVVDFVPPSWSDFLDESEEWFQRSCCCCCC